MSQAIINFKTSSKLKAEAKEVLDNMGLNFSIALNDYLKKIISEKRIEFTVIETPNTRLKKSIKGSVLEYKTGKMKVFKTHKDLEKHLLS